MATQPAKMDLEMLIKVNVHSETDRKMVRRIVDDSIAEYHSRRRAQQTWDNAHEAFLSTLRDPSTKRNR